MTREALDDFRTAFSQPTNHYSNPCLIITSIQLSVFFHHSCIRIT